MTRTRNLGQGRRRTAIALTIAGSDSGGGAGIQADLKTFLRFGVFGTSAVTAITAQNTQRVAAWKAVDVPLIVAQVDAIVADLRPSAVKSGMLPTTAIVRAVARSIREHALGPYVLDPVMVATSGDRLVAQSTVAAIQAMLLPLATLVTPNLDEAEILVGFPVRTLDAMREAASVLVSAHGAGAALVKGGHLVGPAHDVLFHDGKTTVFTHRRLRSRNTHGTGCTLSSAITAQLAKGVELRTATSVALDYVHEAIRTAPGLGSGHGPLNH